MKSYFKILIPLLSITWIMFSMSSCSEDNFDNEEDIVTTTDPDTLNEVVVRGQITDLNGELLTNAKVEMLHGENIRTTVTDNLGNYSFDDLPSTSEKITLRASAEGFITRLGVTHLDKPVLEKNYILAKLDDINQDGSPSSSPLTNDVFEISGKILLDDGTPGVNIKIIMIDLTFTNWLYAITDENGDWSIVSEPRDNIFIAASFNCYSNVVIEENINLIDQDIDLETFFSDFALFDTHTFTGFVSDCNTNEGLLYGNVSISFEGNNKTYLTKSSLFVIRDINNRFSILGGVTYRVDRERINATRVVDVAEEQILSDKGSVFTNSLGETTYYESFITETTTTTRNIGHSNTHKSVGLQLGMEYQVIGDFFLNANATQYMMFASDGKTISMQNTIIDLENENRNGGLELEMGFGYGLNIGRRLQLDLGFDGNYIHDQRSHLKDISRSGISLGGFLGIRYLMN